MSQLTPNPAGETGSSFTWSVPSDLPDGDDYALEISDGSAGADAVNYSPQFELGGGGDTVTTESAVPTTEVVVSISSASSQTQIVISESVSSVPVTTEIPTSEIYTSEPISSSEVHTSEIETSSVVTTTSSRTTSASGTESKFPLPTMTLLQNGMKLTKIVAATGTETESSPTGTSDGSDDDNTEVPDSKAGHLGSPVALICFTVAAMLYFQ